MPPTYKQKYTITYTTIYMYKCWLRHINVDMCVCVVYSCQCARQFYIAQWFRDTTVEAEKTLKAQHTTSGDDQDEDFNETKEEKSTEVLQNAEKRKAFLCSLVSCSSRWQGHLKYVDWSSLMSCLSLFLSYTCPLLL